MRQNTVTCHFSAALFGYWQMTRKHSTEQPSMVTKMKGSSARMLKLLEEVFCGFMPCSICAYYCFSEMMVKYKCTKLHGVTSQNTVHWILINVMHTYIFTFRKSKIYTMDMKLVTTRHRQHNTQTITFTLFINLII
jgi:hypothetical protein